MNGDMYIARSSDQEILEKAERGGVVTSLLKFALETERVDAVLAIKPRGGNRYEGVPVLVTAPARIIDTAGALHCASPNVARYLKEYLDGASNLKIAVVVKPCDAKAIIELAKRTQVNLDNLLLIGLNCTGTLSPAKAKTMLKLEFEVDPADVVAEDIEEDKLIIKLKDGTQKERNLTELEERGYGRRENCRRCETNIPIMADIACGKWGTSSEDATFIEACSQKGRGLIEAAIEAGHISAAPAGAEALEHRREKDEAAVSRALLPVTTDAITAN